MTVPSAFFTGGKRRAENADDYCAHKDCNKRLNMPPRYCCQVCEDSAMAAFERDRERFER